MRRALHALVGLALRRPGALCGGVLVLSLLLGLYAATHLGVNADNKDLLAPDLPFQEDARRFEARFHVLTDSLLVVVDAEDAGRAQAAAERLETRLRRARHVKDVFAPGVGPFWERHALLYRSVPELEEFADHLAVLQPVLGELSHRPTLATLARLVERGLGRAAAGEPGAAEPLPAVLDRLREATVALYREPPLSVSWDALLLRGSRFDPTTRFVLVAEPVMDYDALLPARAAIEEVRRTAREAGLVPERGVRVRITGYPALNHEEMLGLVTDVGLAGVASFLLVLAILGLVFRRARMVAAAALTLVAGLIGSAAFAAAAVGTLNLISIAFGVLFIGLGVDFLIHLGLHVAEAQRGGRGPEEALHRAVDEVGVPLLTCAATTAVGCFAFVPTDYRGVAELGLITGVGLFVIVLLTLTLFPALLVGPLREPARPSPRPGSGEGASGAAGGLTRALGRPGRAVRGFLLGRPAAVCVAAALATLLALPLLPRARFDSNVVKMRNPDTESVRTFNDLLESGESSPWYVDAMAEDLGAARLQAAQLEALPEVERAVTLADYVPEAQEEKRWILADAAFLLDVPPPPDDAAAEPFPVARQIEALRSLHAELGEAELEGAPERLAGSARLLREALGRFLARAEGAEDPEPALRALQESLFARLPEQLERLRRSLEPGRVTLADLPASLRRRMRAADGTARIQVFPAEDLSDDRALAAFVAAVREVAPRATGLPVNVVEFGRATASSLREALALALGVIAALLLVAWRRPADVLAVLVPLVLAGTWTVAVMVLTGLPFNFANVIVLPLLLGIGVDSGIHLVARARAAGAVGEELARSATGRAVFYSAATTLVSFGSLAFAAHRGVASLGVVLVIGMACMLAANLGVLPAWLALRARRSEARAGGRALAAGERAGRARSGTR